jgi:hypothetical protein
LTGNRSSLASSAREWRHRVANQDDARTGGDRREGDRREEERRTEAVPVEEDARSGDDRRTGEDPRTGDRRDG